MRKTRIVKSRSLFCLRGHFRTTQNMYANGSCKSCASFLGAARYAVADKTKYAKTGKNIYLKRAFGIDLSEFNRMFRSQKGCCAICHRHQSQLKQGLAVGHNHVTGKVRGLLCFDCNTSLGKFCDSKERLQSAIDYLGG